MTITLGCLNNLNRIVIKKYIKQRNNGYWYLLECNYCHKQNEISGFKFNEGRGKFCSKKCYGLSKIGIDPLIRKPKQLKQHKFSQLKIRFTYIKLKTFVCDFCKKEFKAIRKTGKRKFCSIKCFKLAWEGKGNPSWMGGKNKDKYDYLFFNERLKKYVYDRDGGKCQICCISVEGKEAHRHHIDRNKQHSTPDNLVLLCRICNAMINKDQERYNLYFQGKDMHLYNENTWLPK